MAVTETPPETVPVVAETGAVAMATPTPTGLAAVLGTGDHKVIGRCYVAASLLFGGGVILLGGLFSVEAAAPKTLDVFSRDSAFQFFTLYRVGSLFLLALPLVIGVAFVMVPLQVGARSIAFPRAAAASFWVWLMGAGLLVASYAVNGGPGGGSRTGVNLWITAMGLVLIGLLTAAVCLATTVFALRTPGLTLDRTPLYAWSVAVAAVMWLMTLPVLFGELVLLYVSHRHGASGFGDNALIYDRLAWVFRNPQIYTVAVPVLGFAADVMVTTARERFTARPLAQGAIAAFGVFGFGAFLAAATSTGFEAPVTILLGLVAIVPILAALAAVADVLRRGSLRLNGGVLYALAAVLALLLGVAGGALGSIPQLDTAGTIYDVGSGTAVLLAALIASLGGLHWWATKVLRQPAKEAPARIAPLLLLVGTAAIAIPDMVSGIVGKGAEVRPDYAGGIAGLNVIVVVGVVILVLGLFSSVAALAPALKAAGDVASDPWEGQTLEWLTPSPPPLENFSVPLAEVRSPEPLVDLREEQS
ncbi:MAG: cbb3-type cytochrome c oxidase subunit I [Acidimicrobiales bacterium]